MWRFILVTFGFLGFAFYEMSGGAGYAPAENSIQARAAGTHFVPTAAPVRVAAAPAEPVQAAQPAPEPATPETAPEIAAPRTVVTSSDVASLQAAQERFEITLASTARSFMPTATADPADPTVAAAAIDAAVQSAMQAATLDTGDQDADDAVFSLETYTATAPAAPSIVPRPTADEIRRVSGSMVNMRTGPGTEFRAVGKLAEGTLVAVLEEPGDGWIMLEVLDTGETGWMADWLVSASN